MGVIRTQPSCAILDLLTGAIRDIFFYECGCAAAFSWALHTQSERPSLVPLQVGSVGEEIHRKIIQESNRETYGDDSNKLNTFKAEISSKTKAIEELESLIKTWVKEYKQFVLETGESQIELTGKLSGGFNQTFDFSNKFLAVLHKINNLN